MDLSIIVPVYNAEKYLKQCLNSIWNEFTEKMELIIIDDGSEDNSLNIYEEYRNENVKIFKNENMGVSYSRNFGLEKAVGKYILFVDADDYLTNGWSKVIIESMQENNDLIIFDQQGKQTTKEEMFKSIFNIKPCIKYMSTIWSKLYKRETLMTNNIRFDENIINGEDMLFNADVVTKVKSINLINKNIYNYRINQYSATHKFNDKIFESDKAFHIKLKEICVKNELDENVYCNWCLENAIYLLVQRMAYMKRKEWKEYIYVFDEEPYRKYIINSRKILDSKNKIVVESIKKGKVYIPIYLFKFVRIVKPRNKIRLNEKIIKI